MNKLHQEILTKLEEIYPEYKEAETLDENLALCLMSNEISGNMMNAKTALEYVETENESYVQCYYYSDKIGYVVILDYDVVTEFNSNEEQTALSQFAGMIADYEEEATKLENSIIIKE